MTAPMATLSTATAKPSTAISRASLPFGNSRRLSLSPVDAVIEGLVVGILPGLPGSRSEGRQPAPRRSRAYTP